MAAITLDNITQLVKRRSVGVFAGVAFSLILLALSSTRLGPRSRPPSYESFKEYPAIAHSHDAPTPFNGTWDFERDRRNYLLSSSQCDKVFPDLYRDLDRAVADRNGKKITLLEMDSIPDQNGNIRGIIYDGQLYVVSTVGGIYSRGIATLLALNRAITTSPEPLPNIEFVLSVDDYIASQASWALTRRDYDKATWLMPDFGYWSWPETKVGSYGEVQDKALAMENGNENASGKAWGWSSKIPKLLWRGATMGLELREKFLKVTEGKDWADVKKLDWHNKESMQGDLKSMDEHCQYKYLINTAGNSYSGRLKYIQNCRSVIIMHEMTWLQHHTHLMKSEGKDQNYVKVHQDFGDLDEKMGWLKANDKRAEEIADNNVKTFRERYLTGSAETCYWRRLIRSWAENSFEPQFWKTVDGKRIRRGLPVESYVLERRLEWEPY